MARKTDELVFAPLGGVGEIGMNLALYGYGRRGGGKWIVVDCGVTFANDQQPGIDLILPDIRFLEGERRDLLGIFLTHAHEDHFGAVIDLWPRLECPVYATPFTAALLRAKMADDGVSGLFPITVVPLGGRVEAEPFAVEYVTATHSIPEPNGLIIETPLGSVYHTGDWKIDAAPQLGQPTDIARLKRLGKEGCRAIICDSTNAMRDGLSPSEGDVRKVLQEMIARAPARVAVTCFASNVARVRSIALAAEAAGRHVVLIGRALHRAVNVAREVGYLDDVPDFLTEDDYGHLPRDKVVAIMTGSQGEPRAALSRIANDDHPRVTLAKGDMVIFSSRTIPGNEKAVYAIQNALVREGFEVVTDEQGLVHVSGHPRRGELEQMYSWLKPEVAIPVHGEARHLHAHAKLARALGVPEVVETYNGDVIRLAPGPAEKIDEVVSGRLHKDGKLLVPSDDEALRDRRRLSFAGIVIVALTVAKDGQLVAEPAVQLIGIPQVDANGHAMFDIVLDAIDGTVDSIPKARRKDPETLAEAVRRAVRAAVNEAWGKKPGCQVMVTRV